jgi:hypothetical protein
MEFYKDEIHTARKTHKCMLCGNEIPVGEKYHRQSGKYEGEFFDRSLHMHCNNIISAYCEEQSHDEFDADWITDWLNDKYCYDCKHKEDCKISPLECPYVLIDFKEVEK